MEWLALIYLVLVVVTLFTPGSSYKTKPELDWASPKVYMNITASLIALTLAILILF